MELAEYCKPILIQIQKKYNHFIEIFDLTTQMEDSLKRNDSVSFQMFLEMRFQVMLDVDFIDSTMKDDMEQLPYETRTLIHNQLNNIEDKKQEANLPIELIKIGEIVEKTKRIVDKTIMIDKIMNKKITGTSSCYK